MAAGTLESGGALTLEAQGKLAILSADSLRHEIETRTEATARVSVGVGNAYNDAYLAVEHYQQARAQRKAAQRALAAFDNELAQLNTDVERYILEQMGSRFRDRYQNNPALQAALKQQVRNGQPGKYINITPLWQWAEHTTTEQAAQTSDYYRNIAENPESWDWG